MLTMQGSPHTGLRDARPAASGNNDFCNQANRDRRQRRVWSTVKGFLTRSARRSLRNNGGCDPGITNDFPSHSVANFSALTASFMDMLQGKAFSSRRARNIRAGFP